MRRLRSEGDLEEPVSAVSMSNSPTKRVSALYDAQTDILQQTTGHRREVSGGSSSSRGHASNMSDGPSSPPFNAPRRESGLRRVPVGSKSAAASPELNRQTSGWSMSDIARAQASRAISPAWDNIHSPWENRPAISHAYSSVPEIERMEEPMHRDEPIEQSRVQPNKGEKTTPTKVAFTHTVSVSSSEHNSERREVEDVEDRDDEFDNELFYSKYSKFSSCGPETRNSADRWQTSRPATAAPEATSTPAASRGFPSQSSSSVSTPPFSRVFGSSPPLSSRDGVIVLLPAVTSSLQRLPLLPLLSRKLSSCHLSPSLLLSWVKC